MKITVNGKEIDLEKGMTIIDYVESKDLKPAAVVVEYNYAVPGRERWRDILLQEGDNLEIVKFIGGG